MWLPTALLDSSWNPFTGKDGLLGTARKLEQFFGTKRSLEEIIESRDLDYELNKELATQKVFEGTILPSDEAYIESLTTEKTSKPKRRKRFDGDQVDDDDMSTLKHFSLYSSQEKTYSHDNDDFTTTYSHELHYKGDEIWRMELNSHLEVPKSLHSAKHAREDEDNEIICEYKSKAKVSKGCLEISVHKITWYPTTQSKKADDNDGEESRDVCDNEDEEEEDEVAYWQYRSATGKKRLSLAKLLQGSAAAYKSLVQQELLEQEYTILNNDSFETPSFSEFIVDLGDKEEKDTVKNSKYDDDDVEEDEHVEDRDSEDDIVERGERRRINRRSWNPRASPRERKTYPNPFREDSQTEEEVTLEETTHGGETTTYAGETTTYADDTIYTDDMSIQMGQCMDLMHLYGE